MQHRYDAMPLKSLVWRGAADGDEKRFTEGVKLNWSTTRVKSGVLFVVGDDQVIHVDLQSRCQFFE